MFLLSVSIEEWVKNNDVLLFWQVKPVVHAFQVYMQKLNKALTFVFSCCLSCT